MNRGILALGAAAVFVAVVGLYVILRSEDDGPAAPAPSGPVNPTSVQKFAEATPGKPRIPSGAVTEQRTGDAQVRDHRAKEHTPIDIPPPPAPARPPRPDGRKIPPQLTSTLGQGIRPLLDQCTAGIPAEARGPKPRIEGEILISIKDHQATVTSATLKLRDVAENVKPDTEQCLARAALGFAAPAGDESDLDDYSITLSLTLP